MSAVVGISLGPGKRAGGYGGGGASDMGASTAMSERHRVDCTEIGSRRDDDVRGHEYYSIETNYTTTTQAVLLVQCIKFNLVPWTLSAMEPPPGWLAGFGRIFKTPKNVKRLFVKGLRT